MNLEDWQLREDTGRLVHLGCDARGYRIDSKIDEFIAEKMSTYVPVRDEEKKQPTCYFCGEPVPKEIFEACSLVSYEYVWRNEIYGE